VTNEAARLAEALRAGKKAQSLSGTQIAEQIERLTGSRPSLMWVSRRLHGEVSMIRALPELFAFADILGLDVAQLVLSAMFPNGEPDVGQAHAHWTALETEYRARVAFDRDWTEALEIEQQRGAASAGPS
jgi:transcriptional regulator with XRE-family HTH domain